MVMEAVPTSEDHPPTVLDVRRRVDNGKGGTKPAPITDKREMYSGVKARVSYTFRAYGGLNTGFTPGVAMDLRNVLKVGDGPELTVDVEYETVFQVVRRCHASWFSSVDVPIRAEGRVYSAPSRVEANQDSAST